MIALVRYLITHTATIHETAIYRNHICQHCGHSYMANQYRCNHCGREEIEETHVERNRVVHPIRAFGILHNFDPKKALIEHFGREKGLKIYHKLAHEIANSLFLRNEKGETITMQWNEELEELEYPASTEEFVTSDEEANWISIWKLLDLQYDTGFMSGLSVQKYNFVLNVADYLKTKGIPPPIEDCSRDLFAREIYIPESISARIPKTKEPDFDREMESSRLAREKERGKLAGVSLLRKKIVDLLRAGEDDIFKLDICLPDHDLGEILYILDYMHERAEIIRFGESNPFW